MSRDSTAFSADLFINGVKVGIAYDTGNGGEIEYESTSKPGAQLIAEAERWCLSQPAYTSPPDDLFPKGFTHPMNLRWYIDQLFTTWHNEKELQIFHKKLQKASIRSIVTGIPDKQFCPALTFTQATIDQILQQPEGIQKLENIIAEKVLPKLAEGELILNSNIPVEQIGSIEIKAKMYIRAPDGGPPTIHKDEVTKRKGRHKP